MQRYCHFLDTLLHTFTIRETLLLVVVMGVLDLFGVVVVLYDARPFQPFPNKSYGQRGLNEARGILIAGVTL